MTWDRILWALLFGALGGALAGVVGVLVSRFALPRPRPAEVARARARLREGSPGEVTVELDLDRRHYVERVLEVGLAGRRLEDLPAFEHERLVLALCLARELE